jgi:hypothetical protein
MPPTEAVPYILGLTAADAIWIATARLHDRYPEAVGFTPAQILDEVEQNHLTSALPKTIYQHIVQHVTATQPAHPNRRRMLTEIGDGLRRLYLEGDAFHPSRDGAQFKPKVDDLPPDLRDWVLRWYPEWSERNPAKRKLAPTVNLMDALEGTWTFGDAETYLRELREGWE